MSVLKKINSKVEIGQTCIIRKMKPGKAKTNQEKKDGKRVLNPTLTVIKSRDLKDKIMKEKRKLANASFRDVNASMVLLTRT